MPSHNKNTVSDNLNNFKFKSYETNLAPIFGINGDYCYKCLYNLCNAVCSFIIKEALRN